MMILLGVYPIMPMLSGQPADVEEAVGQDLDLGVIARRSASGVRAVAIGSSNADIGEILRQAFRSHGAYRVVDPSGGEHADFNISVEPVTGNRVRLQIISGQPRPFEQEVSGDNEIHASLRAADLVVERTVGIPGIFAGRIVFVGQRGGRTDLYLSDLFFRTVKRITDHLLLRQ